MSEDRWNEAMDRALEEARTATQTGDVPVGAVIVDQSGETIAVDRNRREERKDPTAHAEILVIRAVSERISTWRLSGYTLVVTLEPCAMCAGAAVNARLDRIVYGAPDLKAGAVWSLFNIPGDERLNHRCELVSGVRADESAALLREFFDRRR